MNGWRPSRTPMDDPDLFTEGETRFFTYLIWAWIAGIVALALTGFFWMA